MRSCAVLRGALPLLLCATHLGATTLVAVWSPDQLIIGADSSVITSLGAVAIQASACKIGQQSHIREYLSSHRDWYTEDVPDVVS